MRNSVNTAFIGGLLASTVLFAAQAEGATSNKPGKEETRIAGLVDEAIRSSKEHGPKLKAAAAASFLMGVLHGGWNEFNRLVKNVTEHDAEGIRFFVVNVTKKYGMVFEYKSGEKAGENTAQLMPVKYSRANGYATQKPEEIANVDTDEVKKAFANIRSKLKDTGENGLVSILFGPNRNAETDNGGTVYDWQADFARAMERIASKGGPKARLEQAVKAAGIDGNHKPNIEGKWKDTTVKQSDLDKAKANLARLEKQMELQKTETKAAEKAA